MNKRKIDVVVISDVHMGTYGCHAEELLQYLRSIEPKLLILNGDIIDGWQFSKRYFPKSHFALIKEIMNFLYKGVQVVYITGNHDEVLRKYADAHIGHLTLTDKYILEIEGKKIWIFHGDVFDNTTKGSAKILAKFGGKGYDLLILLNRAINYCLNKLGREKVSFSKKVKNGVKSAVKFINKFEQTIGALAIENGFDYVICGHIHQPCKKEIITAEGRVTYLNSGDWVENLTALEYHIGKWKIFQYDKSDFQDVDIDNLMATDLNIFSEKIDYIQNYQP
jgi:UDP-2,3-diacylglucosamine pyrophosphatase LpxH